MIPIVNKWLGLHPTRVLQLDILRGVAVVFVLGYHVVIDPEETGVLAPLTGALQRFGWSGVDLFFVLSGFLVGGLFFKELRERGSFNVSRFLSRRALKIWPSYFAFLVMVTGLLMIRNGRGRRTEGLDALIPNLLHLQNYLGTPVWHTWTLAVEEHFYLALPFLLVLCTRGRPNVRETIAVMPLLTLLILLGCLLLRSLHALDSYSDLYYHATHLRIDSLFFGVFLSYLAYYRRTLFERVSRHRLLLVFLGIALLSPMMFLDSTHPFVWTIGYTCLYLGYGCIIVAFVNTPLNVGW